MKIVAPGKSSQTHIVVYTFTLRTNVTQVRQPPTVKSPVLVNCQCTVSNTKIPRIANRTIGYIESFKDSSLYHDPFQETFRLRTATGCFCDWVCSTIIATHDN